MGSNPTSEKRRQYLKKLGVLSTLPLAGCMQGGDGGDGGDGGTGGDGGDGGDGGTGGDGGNGESDTFSPANNTVRATFISGQTGSQMEIHRIWTEEANAHWPNGIESVVETVGPAPGIVALQEVRDAEPGHAYNTNNLNEFAMFKYQGVDYDFNVAEDFVYPHRFFQTARGLQINHNVLPIENHWEWNWDDVVEYSAENEFNYAWVAGHQRLAGELLLEWEPRLERDDWNFIHFEGGSDARAAMLQEETHAYTGSAITNYTERNDYYKTVMFVMDPDQYPDFSESLLGMEPGDGQDVEIPDNAFITNTEMPTEEAKRVVDLTQDAYIMAVRSDTPDHVLDIYEDVFSAVGQDGGPARERVLDQYNEHIWHPLTDTETITDMVNKKVELFHENDQVVPILEDILS